AVTGVEVDPAELSVVEGTSATIKATVKPENATDKAVSWTSSSSDVATVDADGKVTAVKAGEATVTVTTKDGGKTATCKVTVEKKIINVTGVSLDKSAIELKVGQSEQLTATVTPSDATDKTVSWSSSEKTVATVDENGKVTAVKVGEAIVTVTTKDGEKTATCKVTVKKVEVSSVVLSMASISLDEGGTYQLSATVQPDNATNPKLKWKSENPAVATVDEKGLVKGISAGTTSVTASADGISSSPCEVTVRAVEGIVVEDAEFQRFLQQKFDYNRDGILTQKELDAVTDLNLVSNKIKSLAGIEHLKNLNYLYIRGTGIKSVDLSKNKALEKVYIYDTQKSMSGKTDLSGLTNLKILNITIETTPSGVEFDLSGTDGIENFTFMSRYNPIPAFSTGALKILSLMDVLSLGWMDIEKLTGLTSLYLYNVREENKELTSLDLTKLKDLKSLQINGYAVLQTLNISGLEKLERLDIWSTNISPIDCSAYPTSVTYLHVGRFTKSPKLLNIDKLSNLEKLELAHVDNESLDLSANSKLKTITIDAIHNLKEIWLKQGQDVTVDGNAAKYVTIKYKI
ncbi:MAG: Ig-like domain-containing protein, partial [Candidatus Cryptobacteroides sp.]|nr:Ig-like domain-containing protein [Candidatus Cryptobacteroides sp.]